MLSESESDSDVSPAEVSDTGWTPGLRQKWPFTHSPHMCLKQVLHCATAVMWTLLICDAQTAHGRRGLSLERFVSPVSKRIGTYLFGSLIFSFTSLHVWTSSASILRSRISRHGRLGAAAAWSEDITGRFAPPDIVHASRRGASTTVVTLRENKTTTQSIHDMEVYILLLTFQLNKHF